MNPLLPSKPGIIPAAFIANGVPGTTRTACTARGTQVAVWVPNAPVPAPHLGYFCHGYSLGTYGTHGYTVYSGQPLHQTLLDEWNLVGSLNNAQAGDIVVWHNFHGNHGQQLADHSALITFVGVMHGAVDPAHTYLNSKNGMNVLTVNITLAALIATYGAVYALYRHQ